MLSCRGDARCTHRDDDVCACRDKSTSVSSQLVIVSIRREHIEPDIAAVGPSKFAHPLAECISNRLHFAISESRYQTDNWLSTILLCKSAPWHGSGSTRGKSDEIAPPHCHPAL